MLPVNSLGTLSSGFFSLQSLHIRKKGRKEKERERERQKVEERKRREAIIRKTKWRDQVKENHIVKANRDRSEVD